MNSAIRIFVQRIGSVGAVTFFGFAGSLGGTLIGAEDPSVGAPEILRADRSASPIPDAAEVMRRVLARAHANAEVPDDQHYHYEKRSVFEEFDSEGRLIKSTEKQYQVKTIHGEPFSRLLKVHGRELTDQERAREEKREEEFRGQSLKRDSKKDSQLGENWLAEDIVGRFDFTFVKMENLLRRRCYVISFKPGIRKLAAKTLQEKVLGKLNGLLWVDVEDSEVARLEVKLVEPISLGWFGSIGSVHQCDLNMERSRMPDGFWVNRTQSLVLAGRRFLSGMRYHATEESMGFAKP